MQAVLVQQVRPFAARTSVNVSNRRALLVVRAEGKNAR